MFVHRPILMSDAGIVVSGHHKASEVGVRVTEEAIQILGGNGYTREYPVERFHRDSKIMTIFEGTSEIQQLVIARTISGVRVP